MVGSGRGLSRDEVLALGLTWVITSAVLLWRSFYLSPDPFFFADTDDAMRLVVARDFLNGQQWYDLTQHRLNTPFGAEVHWSRLVDVPVAGLLALTTWLAGPDQALVLTGSIWPLLLLGALLYLSLRIVHEIIGPAGLLPALLLPVLNPALLAEFSPGRMDHHSVVILFTLACLLASLVALRRPRFAWLAGALAGLSFAIAVEGTPLIIGAILAFGLLYVRDPASAPNLRRFGLGLALGTAAALAITRPPLRWLEAACDMISPVFVLATLLIALAYSLVSVLRPLPSAWQRLALLGALGGLCLLGVIALYPQCLAGPYGELDPWLKQNWLASIVEAKPWHVVVFDIPGYAVVVAVPVLLALLTSAYGLWRGDKRPQWIILTCFLVLAALVMVSQVRGARLAIMLSVPAAAWLIVFARRAYTGNGNFLAGFGLIGAWLAYAGVFLAIIVNATLMLANSAAPRAEDNKAESKIACLLPESFATLKALPTQSLMAPIDLGAHILLYTPHAVVAAPYHRNEAGVLDAFRFFHRPIEDAAAIAQKRGLTLLVTCEFMPELRSEHTKDPGTVMAAIRADSLPPWLQLLPATGPLALFSILNP